ncbi:MULTISPECIES: hypothetical protein [unclassified Streptomyces]|uniref:hypothetical protein n=1 Tax=unclassified Streptomyces TaxID=2593676 RepID=UPI002E17F38E|nr:MULTISPECIES: hypothetical protein [unclassified Streptomyces]
MITTDPIGDWTWEVAPVDGRIHSSRAIELAVEVWSVLAGAGVAVPVAEVGVTVRSSVAARDIRLLETSAPVGEATPAVGSALTRVAEQVEEFQGDFIVDARVRCPGVWTTGGVERHAEQLFTIQADVWKNSLATVTLETYCDAWLTMDTRGREQLAIHAENSPRLTLVLKQISALLGVQPTPGDENRYATPTESGFEDVRVEGPAYIDAWGTFEVPARARRLRFGLPPSGGEYPDATDDAVSYLAVQGDGGRVLGYVWAAQTDNAVGFEPRTAVGEVALEAGRLWIQRLRDAYALGLPASAVLNWLVAQPPLTGMGRITDKEPQECVSLDSLEEESGRW